MKFFAAIAIASMAYTTQAWACRPAPLEWRVDLKNDVAARFMTEQGVEISKVSKVEISDLNVLEYRWVESDPRFECHDHEKISAKVTIEYTNEGGNSCVAQGTVIKTEGFYSTAPKNSYEIKDVAGQCLE
ncbi:MAG: hypothetical protein AB7T49_03990 [Oligoflexales bacterium]